MPSGFHRASPFATRSFKRVPGNGPQPSKIMLIGEKPGRDESRRGVPFCGISGTYLNQFLTIANVPRDTIFVTNCTFQFTDYTKPTREELERDLPDLIQEVLACDPLIIGLVGTWAIEWVLGEGKVDLGKIHSVPRLVTELFGGEVTYSSLTSSRAGADDDRGGWLILPMLHPANCVYSPDQMPMILDDCLQLGRLNDGEIDVVVDECAGREDYRIVTAGELDDILDNGRVVVGVDTEGWADKPWSVQFSLQSGTGFVIRAEDTESITKLNSWLKLRRPLVSMHFATHDMEVLEALGVEIDEDCIFDSMVAAYNLCILSQALKSLSYKLVGMEMSSYEDQFSDLQYSFALAYLCRVAGAEDAPLIELPPAPVKTPRKTKKNPNPIAIIPQPVFVRAWPDPEPEIEHNGNGIKIHKGQGVGKLVNRILTDIASGKTLKDGSTTDPRDRWHKLDDKAKAPVLTAIGDMPVPTLDDIELDKAVAYSARDSDAQRRITPVLLGRIHAAGLDECMKMDMDCLPAIYRMQKVGIQLAPPEFWDEIERDCQAQMNTAQYKIFQATGKEINPNSGDQVATLLYDPVDKGGLGLTPPAYTEGGEDREDSRGSTSDKCLQDLLAVSVVAEYISDYREASKVLGTYAVPLRIASQTGDGRVHPNWKYTRTHTGRFSTTGYNVLAIPVRSKLGERCRHGFVAPEGKILYDSDLVQIEMKLAAHESRDETMMKVYRDGGDVHTTMAARAFSVPYDQVEKHQRQAGKICGFGILNGMTAKGLVNQLILYHATKADGSRWSEDDCERLIEEWFATYPGIKRFQQDCVRETQQTGIARETIAGRIRFLPQIWSPNRQVREDAERCTYSHRIQSGANAILRRAVKASWDGLKRERGVDIVALVHDEKLIELPDNEDMRTLVECTVNWAFTTTTKLRVPVTAEGNFGANWGDAH